MTSPRPTSTFIHIEWDKDLLLRAFPPPKPKPETTMKAYHIEVEAKVAAQYLYESALVLAATPKNADTYPHRAEAFNSAMDNMDRVLEMRKAPAKAAA